MYGGLAIVVIGGWRFLIGLAHQHPVVFLAWMAALSLGILAAVGSPGRLSARGKAYVAQLKPIVGAIGSGGSHYALAAAVLGMSALAGTPYEDFGKLFKKSQASSSGGCGAGCGDGGGGCGGCGG